MSPKIGTSTSISRVNRGVSLRQLFDWYVSSVSGSDSNGGTSKNDAFDSIDDVSGVASAGDVIGVEGGHSDQAFWGPGLDRIGLTVYGSGIVSIDLADELPDGDWSLATNQTSTYEQAYSEDFTTDEDRHLFEDGSVLTQQSSISDVESNPGSFYDDEGANTVYVHPTGSTDPSSDGKLYEFTLRPYWINFAGSGVDRPGKDITGPLKIVRSGSFAGALKAGTGTTVSQVYLRNHGKHHTVDAGGVVRDCVFAQTYNGWANGNALQWFQGSGVSTKQPATTRRTIFRTASRPLYAHSNGAGFNDGLSEGDAFISTKGPQLPGQPTYKSYFEYTSLGQAINGNSDVDLTGSICDQIGNSQKANNNEGIVTPSATVYTSLAFDSAANRQIDIQGTHITKPQGGTFFIEDQSSNTNDILFDDCILIALGGNEIVQNAFTVRSGSRAIFLYDGNAEVNLDGTSESLSSLISRYPNLDGSAFMTPTQFRNAFPDWRKGDFQMAAEAEVTHPDGTVSDTMPNGDPVADMGAQQYYHFGDEEMKSKAPPQWPTPPRTESADETFIKDPDSWDFYATPHDHSTDTSLGDLLVAWWDFDGNAGESEPDQVGSNDLPVANGSIGSGTVDGIAARTFDASDGTDDYFNSTSVESDLAQPPSGFWVGALLRIDEVSKTQSIANADNGSGGYVANVQPDGTLGLQATGLYAGEKTSTFSVTAGTAHYCQWAYDHQRGRVIFQLDDQREIIDQQWDDALTAGGRFMSGFRVKGAIARPFVAKHGPSDADMDWLYNSGSYRTLADLQGRTVTLLDV